MPEVCLFGTMGLLFEYIPKEYKHPLYDVIIADFAQFADYQWNIGQTWIFRQNSS